MHLIKPADCFQIWIISIWLVTFVCGFIPHFIFNTARVIDRENDPQNSRWASCSLSPYWIPTWQVYVQIVYAVFLLAPALAIIGISIAIAVLLRKRTIPPGDTNAPSFVSISKGLDDKVRSKRNILSSSYDLSPQLSGVTTPNSCGTPKHKDMGRKMLSREAALQRRREKDKRAVVQLFLIVGSFLFGYIPLTGEYLLFEFI